MIVSQHSNRLPEFIQQGGRIDACGSDALTSVAGGYQGGSFGVVRRQALQLTLQCFVKSACYQWAAKLDTTLLGPLATFTRPGSDQLALEFSQAAKHSNRGKLPTIGFIGQSTHFGG